MKRPWRKLGPFLLKYVTVYEKAVLLSGATAESGIGPVAASGAEVRGGKPGMGVGDLASAVGRRHLMSMRIVKVLMNIPTKSAGFR